ncbi:hypothetical protein M5K25_016618 [Dendrobium thyrsiflorum]|uniref:Uncharacterized protein n=1 Tax=Dendrobium thyrsiflorum TaxID=117978 RepID=A0ABD0UKK8_DENTH
MSDVTAESFNELRFRFKIYHHKLKIDDGGNEDKPDQDPMVPLSRAVMFPGLLSQRSWNMKDIFNSAKGRGLIEHGWREGGIMHGRRRFRLEAGQSQRQAVERRRRPVLETADVGSASSVDLTSEEMTDCLQVSGTRSQKSCNLRASDLGVGRLGRWALRKWQLGHGGRGRRLEACGLID